MEKIKINNSYDAAIKSGKWSKPGADFFNKIKNNKYLLKEAYLEVGDVKSDTAFSSSGCKYPHHVIKDGELVVSIPGIQAAYARAKQMGVCTGKLKAHLERHYKEMGIYQGSKLFSENVIEDNFNFIEDVLSINRYTESFNEYYENECNDLANRFKAAGITTAEKLFDIMSKWEYYSPKDWKLQSPMKTFITKRGNCHDLSLFSYEMLKRISSNYYTNQLFFIEVNDDDETGGKTHTLTFYTKDNHQLFWIEASWDDHKGIHGPYESVMKLEQAVTKAWEETNSTYDRIEFFTSNTYKVGMDLDAYVNSFVRYNENVETQINEYSEWIDKVTNNELFRESVFEENINNKKDFDELILDKWFVKSDDGVENCCLKIKGYDKPFRGRSNLALLKFEDGELYVMAKHDNKCFWCPGGGWDKNETKEHAAIRECHEEAKCNVKDVERLGTRLEWHDEPVKWVIDHVKDPDQRWYGYYTAIFVGVYDGPYTRNIDKEDQESGFKWEKYKDIRNKLLPEYPKAIDKYLKGIYAESVEFLSLFDEKSHSNLKYCYRVGFDADTGEQVAVEFELDPDQIIEPDTETKKNVLSTQMGASHKAIGSDASLNKIRNKISQSTELIKSNIKKSGYIDFVTKDLNVHAIFTRTRRSLEHVRLVPLMNGKVRVLIKALSFDPKFVNINDYNEKIDKIISSDEFKEKITDITARKEMDDVAEDYVVGKPGGAKKYKSTKLIWKQGLLSSHALTPIIRGFTKNGPLLKSDGTKEDNQEKINKLAKLYIHKNGMVKPKDFKEYVLEFIDMMKHNDINAGGFCVDATQMKSNLDIINESMQMDEVLDVLYKESSDCIDFILDNPNVSWFYCWIPQGFYEKINMIDNLISIIESDSDCIIIDESNDDVIEDESLFDEKSHGKLKHDFRIVKDANTGHELILIYDLKNINISYPGHAHDISDFNGIAKDNATSKELKDTNAKVQKSIAKTGNIDHQSSGQTLIAVKDKETGEQWSTEKNPGKEFNVVGYYADKIYDSTPKTVKLGEVDNNPTFKSTLLFNNMNFLSNIEGILKNSGRKSSLPKVTKHFKNERKFEDEFNEMSRDTAASMKYALRYLKKYGDKDPKEMLKAASQFKKGNKDEATKLGITSNEDAELVQMGIIRLANSKKLKRYAELFPLKVNDEERKLLLDALKSGKYKMPLIFGFESTDADEDFANIVESADDNMLFGISVGKDITESINTLKSTVQNESSDDTTLMTLFVKAGLPAHTVEILENMNICSSRLDDTDEYVFCIESDKWINLIESFISDDIDSKILKFIELFESYKNHEILPTIIFPEEYTTECYSNILQKNINDIKVVLFDENGDFVGLESTMFTEADDNPPPEIEETNDVTSAIEKNTKDEPSEDEIKDEEDNILDTEIDNEPQKEESEPEEKSSAEEEVKKEPKNEEIKEEPPAIEEPKDEEPKSLPKQADAAEANKNGVNRKKLYIAFIEYAKSINPKNVFGSVFDKEVFHVTYPFIPQEMRYFYRLANPTLCVLKDDLTFFELSELKKINADNKEFPKKLIFAATPDLYYLFNIDDKKVYTATEGNGALTIKDDKLSFDLFIQNMVNKGDILNGPPEIPKEKEAVDDGSIE